MKSQPSLSVVRRLAIQRGEDPTEAVLKFRAARHAALVECAEAARAVNAYLPGDQAHDSECTYNDQPDGYESDELCDCGWPALRAALALLDEVEGEK